MKPPINNIQIYNQRLDGVYGEFGAGADVQALYIQTAITPKQLDRISLISEIRGSERWPVRDLFQRDVDNDRVTYSLLPYLQEADKVKFFNPLTLTLLPMEETGSTVLTQMPKVREFSMDKDNRSYVGIEREDFYRIRWVLGYPQYATIEWNDTRSLLVAIDGQHRLSALKRFHKDTQVSSHRDFLKWRIPVVIVSFRAGPGRAEPPSVLEVVRSIFVYINTEAREVNEARKILLTDESVTAVCTQELLERSHANDLRGDSERDAQRLPLLFYDWRGEETKKRKIHAPAAVKSVEEIHNWFKHYILGEDFDEFQETQLGIDPTHPLHESFHDKKLSYGASKELRSLVKKEFLPSVAYLLENFAPYRSYVSALWKLERKYENTNQSDLARHAFYELRFGTNHAPDPIRSNVARILGDIKNQIEDLKKKFFHKPIDLDIAMRGVISAFGHLRDWVGNPSWSEYAKWFAHALNRTYENGWLDFRESSGRRKFLLHIAQDHNDAVVNYRFDKVSDALGPYLELLVAAYGRPWPESWDDDWWPTLREIHLETLSGTILRGFKKQVRPQLKEEYPLGGKVLTAAVNREAQKLAGRQIRKLERELEKIEAAAPAE